MAQNPFILSIKSIKKIIADLYNTIHMIDECYILANIFSVIYTIELSVWKKNIRLKNWKDCATIFIIRAFSAGRDVRPRES